MNDTASPSKQDEKLLDPSATAKREYQTQVAKASPRNSGSGSPSTKQPEADRGIVAQLRGPSKTGYGGMTMVNGGAAATSNKSQPEPEKPKAVSRDWGMER